MAPALLSVFGSATVPVSFILEPVGFTLAGMSMLKTVEVSFSNVESPAGQGLPPHSQNNWQMIVSSDGWDTFYTKGGVVS